MDACQGVFEHERKVGLVLTRGAICVRLLGNRGDWAERALDASFLWIFWSLTSLPSGTRQTSELTAATSASDPKRTCARRRRSRALWLNLYELSGGRRSLNGSARLDQNQGEASRFCDGHQTFPLFNPWLDGATAIALICAGIHAWSPRRQAVRPAFAILPCYFGDTRLSAVALGALGDPHDSITCRSIVARKIRC